MQRRQLTMVNKLTPSIRFDGFTDAWEQSKLGEVSDVTKLAGFEFTKYVTYQETGKIIALRGLNVKNGHLILNDIKYIDKSDFSKLNRSKLYKNDILFTYVGTVGELAIVPEDDRYYLAPNVARIRLISDTNPIFVSQMMNSTTFYKRIILPLIATSSQPALSMESVRKFELMLPTATEQTKIGNFFKQLDDTIALHQRELDLLKEQKKGFLQKMFPKKDELVPEIRFEGFTDAWEQRKLGDLADTFEYGLNASAKEYDGQNKYLRITDIDDESRQFKTDSITSPNIDLDLANNYILKKGDILFARTGASVGKTYRYIDTDGIVYYAGFLIRARINHEFNAEFIFQNTLTDAYCNYIKVTSQRSGQPGVNAQEYAKFEIKVPEKEEQTKIGNFFKQLDDSIALHQSKLDLLKELKKGYLQKMFV